jgi:transcriptional regulator with XRE-family HTH domain
MKKDFESFAVALKCLREGKRLSLRQLAAKIKKGDGTSISPTYLHDIENNNRIPSAQIIVQIANELTYDADKLLVLAERISPAAEELLKDQPVVAQLLRKAKEVGFTEWEKLQKLIEEETGYK